MALQQQKTELYSFRLFLIHCQDILHTAYSQIEIQSSNIAIADNVFDNSDEKKYLYKYEIENGDNNNYNLYLWKNTVEEDKENIINSESLTVYRDYETIKQYIKDKFNEILQK